MAAVKMRQQSLSFGDKVQVAWFLLDGITHLTLEAAYLWIIAAGSTPGAHDSFVGFVWREYARADRRYAIYDPVIVSLEIPSVFVWGPLCLLLAWGIARRAHWRHLLAIVVCVNELVAAFLYFATEILDGSPNVCSGMDTCPVLLWLVYFLYLNGIWVVIPAIILYDSCVVVLSALRRSKVDVWEAQEDARLSPAWFHLVLLLLLLFAVIVPVAIAQAKYIPPFQQ